jgi:predicted enzyme related to lactoylglutathione lyase
MTPTLKHFSINADDLARARRFYEKIFGWTFHAWGPPGFFMIAMGEPESGVRGSLQGRRELEPGLKLNGLECTFAVDDVERVAAAVRANGGRILMERTILAGIGELIFFQDPEGNVAGAMRYDETAE